MKVKFIYPSVIEQYKGDEMLVPQMRYPLLTFPVLAAHTPADIDIEIIDESIEAIDFDEPVDLVGLTAMTYSAPRAYEIADRYRKRGVKTVMGGFHVSALPEEAQEHVDTIVIGEGEEVWPSVVEDFKKGQLKPRYTSPGLLDMAKYKTPRLDLLKKYLYTSETYTFPYYAFLNVIEVSRGCPYKCGFCSVSKFYGRKHRFRPIKDVMEDIRRRKLQSRMRFISFSDANLYGNKSHFKELLKGLKKLNIKWSSQISIDVAKSPEILSLMAESGCQSVCFGIESISQESLNSVDKATNKVEEYDKLLERMKNYNIYVALTMIMGFDHDDDSIFERTYSWVKKHLDSVILVHPHILTPYPGTAVYRQFLKENRIVDFDWRHYDHWHVVYKPGLMSAGTLYKGYRWLLDKLKPVNSQNWQKWFQP